jgi:hypothetical protein
VQSNTEINPADEPKSYTTAPVIALNPFPVPGFVLRMLTLQNRDGTTYS